MSLQEEICILADGLSASAKLLTAIGDETRRRIDLTIGRYIYGNY